jgi:serine/threonine-protein kinase
MGDVYEAIDEKLGVTFALKMVRADRVSPAFAERFRQEVRAMMLVDHPNIARIYSHGEAGGRPYFTMKFVRGGTLADKRADFINRPTDAVELMLKVIDAVDYLHRQGHVHRDLKPSNILLDEFGVPFLSDFGLVKDVTDAMEIGDISTPSPGAFATSPEGLETLTATAHPGLLTRTGDRLGTHAYMSPEAARGDTRQVGPAADIWALGIILHELFTGARPTPFQDETNSATDRRPNLDPMLQGIVAKCLSPNPASRYTSAARLAADLRAWLRQTRGRRRFALLTAGAILMGAIAIYVAILWPAKLDAAADWRSWARRELRAGRPVTLVDAKGNPAPSMRFIAGEKSAKAERDSVGWWTVHTTDEALAEFLDNPGVDSFTLTGDVRGNRLASIPEAGLFVAHRRIAQPDGDWHFHFEYVFQECAANFRTGAAPARPPVPPPGKGIAIRPDRIVAPAVPPGKRLARLRGSQLADGPGNNSEDLGGWEIGADAQVEGGPWRCLRIRASNSTFTVSWDGQDELTTSEFTASQLGKMQILLRERPDPPLQFSVRGGIGVYVKGGSASFRNLTVVPGLFP